MCRVVGIAFLVRSAAIRISGEIQWVTQ
jgi:hypothetical protein